MNRTNLDFTVTARKNHWEYSENTLNDRMLIDTNIMINSSESNNATVAPITDPNSDMHHNAQYWLIYIFKVLLFFILFVIYFKGIKSCCILPALRRLGWINDTEPEPLNTLNVHSKPVDNGYLCKKAGLSGMLMEERKLVVDEVFKNTHFCYDLSIPLSEQKAQIMEQEIENEDYVNTLDKMVVSNVHELLHAPSSINDDDNVNQCSICLSSFIENNIVMRTNKCEHVFHVDCSMGWFYKHDYCPYCRCEIMSSTEMLQAAIIVLGKDRVDELSQCNKMSTTSQEPQHGEPEMQNEAETDSNSLDIVVQSREG